MSSTSEATPPIRLSRAAQLLAILGSFIIGGLVVLVGIWLITPVENIFHTNSGHIVLGVLLGSLAATIGLVVHWLATRKERRRLARRLAESRSAESMLESLLEAAPIAIIAIDDRGMVRDVWNQAAEQIFGWTREETLGKPVPFIPPDRIGEFEAMHRQVLGGVAIKAYLLDRLKKDGNRVSIRLSASLVPQVDDRPPLIMAVIGDVTAEIQSLKTMEMQAAILDQVSDAVISYDADCRITLWNQAAEELYGWKAEEMLGTVADSKLRVPDSPMQDHLAIKRELEAVGRLAVEMLHRHRDGKVLRIESRLAVIRNNNGVITGYVAANRDVTERRDLEDRLARLSTVVEQSAEAVIITTPAGAIVYVNPAFEKITGYSSEMVLGKNPRLLNSGLQAKEIYEDMWTTLLAGGAWYGRLRNRRRDGKIYTADALISPVLSPDRETVYYVGIQRDITRESELDDQLRQAQKMEALGQFTAGIAHDFNNLLTVILCNLEILGTQIGPSGESIREILTDAEQAGRRGAELIRKLLAFGRHERIELKNVDLGICLKLFSGTISRVLPETIELSLEIPKGLPLALADEGAVDQIILNLVTNARDAMPDGGKITIRLDTAEFTSHGDKTVSGWYQPGSYCRITVMDTGIGMTSAVMDRVFEPFFTTKAPGEGSGLGLPMVYGLVKQHRGFIILNSVHGTGTEVQVYLPVSRQRNQLAEFASERHEVIAVSQGGGEIILLVEDEPALRRVGNRILSDLGYKVLTASDGEEALELALDYGETIALLITDVVMPKMNGPTLVARLRETGRQLSVLYTSGYAPEKLDTLEDPKNLVWYIEKPWTVDDLISKVRSAIDSKPPIAG